MTVPFLWFLLYSFYRNNLCCDCQNSAKVGAVGQATHSKHWDPIWFESGQQAHEPLKIQM